MPSVILTRTFHPIVRRNVNSMIVVVTTASQTGMLRANTSPVKAVAASTTALSPNARSKGMGEILNLRRHQDTVDCCHGRLVVGIGPGHDDDGIAALAIKGQCGEGISEGLIVESR